MPTLEALRHTLTVVEELRSIVHTMKILAAASIRQYEQAVSALTDYDRAVRRGLAVVLGESNDGSTAVASEFPKRDTIAHTPHPIPPPQGGRESRGTMGRLAPPPLAGGGWGEGSERLQRNQPRIGVLVFGSDHGLCGRFNEVLAAHVGETLQAFSPSNRRVVAIGLRQAAVLAEQGLTPEQQFSTPGAASAIHHTVRRLLPVLEQWQAVGMTEVRLFHNRHRGGNSHEPTSFALLPLDPAVWSREPTPASRSLPGYAAERADLLAALLREWFFVELFRACAESLASEHASRLLAMQTAERNIEERLGELNILYRQQRQEAITAELLDVVAGFEALVSSKAAQG